MAIKAGQPANADDVLNAMGSLFNDTAQNIFNAAYLGFDSKLNNGNGPIYKNIYYDTDLSETYVGGITTLYDFSGTSVDTDYWTLTTDQGSASSITQSDNKIHVKGGGTTTVGLMDSAQIVSNGTTGIKFLDGYYRLKYDYNISSGSTNHYGDVEIGLTDGTNYVYLVNVHLPSASGTFNGRLNINKTGGTCFATEDLSDTTDTGIDLSSLTGSDWYFTIYVKGYRDSDASDRTYASVNLELLSIFDTSTADYEIALGTTSTDIYNMLPIVNMTLDGTCSYSLQVSSDGINYYDATNTNVILLTIKGTSPILKISLTGDGNYIPSVNEYAIKYNLTQ